WDLVFPKQAAVTGADAAWAAGGGLHVNASFADLGNDDGGVAGTANAGPRCRPQGCARVLIECGHRGPFAAGRAHNLVAIDQDGFAVTPAVAFLAAEIFLQVFTPAFLAAGGLDAYQVAVAREGVDEVAVDRGRGPGAGPVLFPG